MNPETKFQTTDGHTCFLVQKKNGNNFNWTTLVVIELVLLTQRSPSLVIRITSDPNVSKANVPNSFPVRISQFA